MSGQLQLRRGSTAENDAFTGVEGELTYDTVKKELRIHDGVTQGGNKVPTLVAVQRPTAENNYTWYRKYSDGWVEQGGFASVNECSTTTINLPVVMADTNYTALAQNNTLSTAQDAENGVGIQRTGTTQVKLFTHYINPNTISASWQVSGMAAE